MKLKIWGSRGSIPAPFTPLELEAKVEKYLRNFCHSSFYASQDIKAFIDHEQISKGKTFGGNTTCVELKAGEQSLIIDGGSGLRLKGNELMAGPCGRGQGEVHIYMTHFHWDHVMGIPFFVPIFIPGNQIHFYGVDPKLEEVIKLAFTKPYFPVPFSALASKIHFHQLSPRQSTLIQGFEVTPYKLDHPDPCWGAKISHDGKNYAHVVDNEAKRVSVKDLGEDLPLYQNIDLMYFDAQYGFDDLLKKIDWGHSSSFIGMDLAFREKIKKVVFTHHDPMASDEQILKMMRSNNEYYKMQKPTYKNDFEWCFAYDGLEIDI
jgi:phosphoribosyl 1,2-cyclic phosphodiesterase